MKRATAICTPKPAKTWIMAASARAHKVAWMDDKRKGEESRVPGFPLCPDVGLFLQLPLQEVDLVGERNILGDQRLDLADGMQHGGVVATAEAASDFRQ